MSLTFRRISIVLGLLLLIGSVFLFRKLSEDKTPPEKKEMAKISAREVKVRKVKNGDVKIAMDIQGTLEAYNKIDIFAEVTGALSSTTRPLKVGSYFKKGSVLLDIDREEAKLNILSQKSQLLNAITTLMPDLKIDYPESFTQWKNYLDNFNVEKPILAFPEPVNDQEKFFIASRNLLSSYYAIKSAENRLRKYTVYAPISGVITESNVHPGSLVRAGQKMGVLMGTGLYEMKATVGLKDLQFIKTGTKVKLFSDATGDEWTGTVRRISDQIDPNTQSVIVYVGVSGKNLREGMYLRGNLNTRSIGNATKIPLNLLVNQNQVYVVEDGQLALLEVEIVNRNASHAVVKGLSNQTLMLAEQLTGAYEGLAVEPLELTASVD